MERQTEETARSVAAINRQVEVMETQTSILGRSVIAAENSAIAALNDQRSWILVEKIGPPPELFPTIKTDVPGEITAIQLVFGFKVFGRTPARLTEYRFRFHIVNGKKAGDTFDPDLPGMPDYGAAKNVLNNPEMNATLAQKRNISGKCDT